MRGLTALPLAMRAACVQSCSGVAEHIALADAGAERVALLPGTACSVFCFQARARNQAGMLARQFDAGGRAQAQLARRLLDLVDAEPARDLVEEDVAGLS